MDVHIILDDPTGNSYIQVRPVKLFFFFFIIQNKTLFYLKDLIKISYG